MRRRNLRRGLGRVQRLEDRRLLAADLSAIDLAPVESFEPETCQIADLDTQGDTDGQVDQLDLDVTEIQEEVLDDSQADVDQQVDVDLDNEAVEEVDSTVHDLGDPVDGTDGFFGAIDAENPSQTFSISPTEDGMIDVVVASSFGDAETRLEVIDSGGNVVASTMTEELSGFQQLSFEAEAGETFELTVGSEEGAEGYFQVTVGHNETPEPVDMHADTIGEDSTPLDFADGSAELTGELELAGDVDTFQFTADSNGKMSLSLAELNADNATELQVQILDVDGQMLTRGITNETVGISFDVENGTDYFVAVSAGEGQAGTYQMEMALEADEVDSIIDDVVDEIDDIVVDEVVGDPVAEVDPEVVDEVVADGVEVDDAVIDEVVADPEVGTEVADEMCDATDVADPSTEVAIDNEGEIPVEIIDSVEDSAVAIDGENVVDGFDSTDTAIESESDEELEVAVVEEVTDAGLPDADEVDDETLSDFEPIDSLIDEEMEICFSDLDGELEFVDSFFAEFDPASIFTVNDRYELRRMT